MMELKITDARQILNTCGTYDLHATRELGKPADMLDIYEVQAHNMSKRQKSRSLECAVCGQPFFKREESWEAMGLPKVIPCHYFRGKPSRDRPFSRVPHKTATINT